MLFLVFATHVYTPFLGVTFGGHFFYAIRIFKSLFCFLFCIISFPADANFLLFASRWCDSFSLLRSVSGGPSSMADQRNGKGERESIDRLVNSCLACLPSLNGTITDVYLYFTRRGFTSSLSREWPYSLNYSTRMTVGHSRLWNRIKLLLWKRNIRRSETRVD